MAEKEPPIEGELMPSDKGGAPTKYTPLTVNKLIAAFNNGFNVQEACQYAGISRETYYNWREVMAGFSDKMEEAMSAPNRKAKEIVVSAINSGDANLAFRYLQARDPDFKAKGEIELLPGKRAEEKLKEFMDDGNDDAYPANITDVASAESPTETIAESGTEVAPSPSDIS